MLSLSQVVAHWWQRFSLPGAMKISGDHPNFGGDTSGASLVYFPRRLFVDIRIVKPQHRDGRAHHVHGISIFWGRLYELDNRIRQLSLGPQRMHEFIEFAAVRQLPFPQKVDDLLVTDFSSQIVDVVTGINE